MIPFFQPSIIPFCSVRLRAKRKTYPKGGPLIHLAPHGNISERVRDDLLGDRKPQTGTHGFGAEHKIENLGEMLFGDPFSVILYDDENILLRCTREEIDHPSFRDGLNAVDEE